MLQYINIKKLEEFVTMQDKRSQGVNGQHINNQAICPFNSNFQGPPNMHWESYPGYATSFFNKLGSDLASLTKTIINNNQNLASTLQKIDTIRSSLEEAQNEVKQNLLELQKLSKEGSHSIVFSELNQQSFETTEPLIPNIFKRQLFKYKLRLEHRIPKIIYKDRKLSFRIRLVNPDSSAICNVNLIHLCVGACDQNGDWILTEDGDLFIGGKIEVDLYHGQAQFKRIYPCDISRRYSTNNINLVIYPKRSILKFIGEKKNHEKEVDPEEIEPLVISDVLVKAKKKM